VSRPQTVEGHEVWDLAMKLGGQLRVVGGGLGRSRIIGFDMTAAMALARALEIDRKAAAELLPVIEAQMVREFNGGEQDG